MRWMWVYLCIVCAWAHASAQVNLADEPRLQRPITLWLKMEPLRDVLRTASRQTGVALRCQDAIQHQKVSIFVENRPAAEILTQLASLFRDDYITLAERMNNTQAVWYSNDDDRAGFETFGRQITVRFSWNTLANNLRGLRFLASLGSHQRKQLLQGDWIPASTLTLAQRRRFQEALEDRFPPPERLFVIDAPYTQSPYLKRHEVLGLGSDEEPPDMLVPYAPAFRLRTYSERPVAYWLHTENGPRMKVYISPRVGLEWIASQLSSWEKDLREFGDGPVVRASVVHSQGCILELQAPPTQRKTYSVAKRP